MYYIVLPLPAAGWDDQRTHGDDWDGIIDRLWAVEGHCPLLSSLVIFCFYSWRTCIIKPLPCNTLHLLVYQIYWCGNVCFFPCSKNISEMHCECIISDYLVCNANTLERNSADVTWKCYLKLPWREVSVVGARVRVKQTASFLRNDGTKLRKEKES